MGVVFSVFCSNFFNRWYFVVVFEFVVILVVDTHFDTDVIVESGGILGVIVVMVFYDGDVEL